MELKKNLLFVFADQWRRSAVGFMGEEPVLTEHIDTFAHNSVICTNGVSTAPLCSPARASLLTGKHPLETGVFTNCKIGTDIRLRDDEICISDVLKKEGYQTAYIGKWHLDEPEANHTKTPKSGAKNWDAYTPPGPRRHGFDFWYAYNACDNHTHPHYWNDDAEAIYSDTWSPIHETDIVLEYLNNRSKEQPFALFLSWNPPHNPYDTAPEQYKSFYESKKLSRKPNVKLGDVRHHTEEAFPLDQEAFNELQKGYYAAITGLDDQFGRIIEFLTENDLLKDTLVVLTADHGDMLASHQLIGKHVWFEESIGVPLIFGGMDLPPGKTGTVIGSPDIAPTILDLLDIESPESMSGVSCAQFILEGTTDKEKVCYIAACPGRDVFLEEFKRAGADPRQFGWRAVRAYASTYVVDVGYTPSPNLNRYFYDLATDPDQLSPTIVTTPMAVESQLKNWLIATGDAFLEHLE